MFLQKHGSKISSWASLQLSLLVPFLWHLHSWFAPTLCRPTLRQAGLSQLEWWPQLIPKNMPGPSFIKSDSLLTGIFKSNPSITLQQLRDASSWSEGVGLWTQGRPGLNATFFFEVMYSPDSLLYSLSSRTSCMTWGYRLEQGKAVWSLECLSPFQTLPLKTSL